MAISAGHGSIDPTLQGIHVPYQFLFANSAARTAGTGYTITASDVGKYARQSDNNTVWMLTNHSPIAWKGMSPDSAAPSTHASTHNSAGSDPISLSGIGAAGRGANSDITSLSGLTTPLSVAQGGTAATTAANARTNLGVPTLAGTNSFVSHQTFSGGATLAGPVRVARTAVNDHYTVLTSDVIVGITDTSAARTITLPTAISAGGGFELIIKDESGAASTNNITIDPGVGVTIDGVATIVISANYGTVRLYCDGTNWFTW